jgi:hypothetical protein
MHMQQCVKYLVCVLWIVRGSKSCMHMQQRVNYLNCVLRIVRACNAVCTCSKVLNTKIRVVSNTIVKAACTCSKALNNKMRIVSDTRKRQLHAHVAKG